MLEKQIWNHNFPQFWSTDFGQYRGLFGLYSLEGQTKGITQIFNTSWLQLVEKIMKIQLFSLSGLLCDLQKFFWPFCIFLRSLIPKKFSGMQKSYFWTGFHHQTLTNQKSYFESLWLLVQIQTQLYFQIMYTFFLLWYYKLPFQEY
jgi:hypothetical protein